MQLPVDKGRTQMEQFSLSGTPETKICYRCGYEGHIKRYCNNHVYCDYCRTYTHHTSVCRSHQRQVQSQPITSSRRNSPTVYVDKTRSNETTDRPPQRQNTPNKEEGLSDITRKHLAQIISTMIPSNSNTLNEGGATTTINTILKEDNIGEQPNSRTEEKQVVINNFYIPSGDGGWKRLETGEIPPVSSTISGEKSGLDCKKAPTNNGDSSIPGEAQQDPRISYKEDTKVRDLMAPPQNFNFNQPPPQPHTTSNETAAMLECMRQLQLTLQQHVTTSSRQTDYHMSQNADLFTEMIKAQNRRELDPTLMAIPTFSGMELEKCMDWINRIRNVCDQSE